MLGCTWATNAGFFQFTPPACEGNLIAQGKVIQLQPAANVNLGTTSKNTTIVGFLSAGDVQKNTFG